MHDNANKRVTAPLIAIRARQLQRVANSARIEISNCTFRGNGDLFAVSEHEGNASLAASDEFALHLEFDAARFAENYGSALYHSFDSAWVGTRITFGDCEWSHNGADNTSLIWIEDETQVSCAAELSGPDAAAAAEWAHLRFTGAS